MPKSTSSPGLEPSQWPSIAASFAADPAKFALTVRLTRLMFPYLGLISLAVIARVLPTVGRRAGPHHLDFLGAALFIGGLVPFLIGLTNKQAAQVLGISPATADRYWRYARSWLRLELQRDLGSD